MPRGGLLPPPIWPGAMGGHYGAEACHPEAFNPTWPAVANAAAVQAATAALHDSFGRGGAPIDMQQLMAAHWAAAAASMAAPTPHHFLGSAAFFPQSMPAGLAETRRTIDASATSPDKDRREVCDDLGMAELDLAVTKLLEGCDDGCYSGGHISSFGHYSPKEVPMTPPPRGAGELQNITPAKVALASARSPSPEPPPGLKKRHGDDHITSPVQLKLSSMAFPGGSAFSEEEVSRVSIIPLELPRLPVDCADGGPAMLGTSPGIAGGAFLLNLLRAGPQLEGSEPPADKGRREAKATLAASLLPTTASTASTVASPATATAGDAALEASLSAAGRRPTRRGRRAGQTRYH